MRWGHVVVVVLVLVVWETGCLVSVGSDAVMVFVVSCVPGVGRQCKAV